MVDVNAFLECLTPEQWDEWVAFEQLEPTDGERLHAQLSAIGGAILFELRLVTYWLSSWGLQEGDAQSLAAPSVPDPADLDPLSPRNAPRKGRSRAAAPPPESEWMAPCVAAAAFGAALVGVR